MKKILALVLTVFMLMGCVSAFASDYDEPVKVSLSTLFLTSGKDYTTDPLAQYFLEKFNLELDVWINDNSTHDSTTRTWVNGGTMPNVTQWMSFNATEYRDWVDQGLIAPLPDGWEEQYPNLLRMINKIGLYDIFCIDGKTYGFPHAGLCNFVSMDVVPAHNSIFYRVDWAKELGCEWAGGAVVTLSQLREYIEGCIEKDFSGTGATIGLTGGTDLPSNFVKMAGFDFNGFLNDKEAGQYFWGPSYNVDAIAERIATAREWYKAGLIDPDFYLHTSTADAENLFLSGKAAAVATDGPINNYIEMWAAFDEANPDLKGEEVVSAVALADDDGTVYTQQATNYWTATVFSPETTEEQMHRILAIADYGCTPEGEIIIQMGLPGVDWDYDENGNIVAIDNAPGSVSKYDSYYIWTFLNILSDDFSFISPAFSEDVRNHVTAVYDAKGAGVIIPFDFDYAYYTSDAKSVYSVNILDKVSELVITDSDITESWNAFIADNAGMVDPLLAELNEYFY